LNRQEIVLTEPHWNRDRILSHIATHLPVAALFGIEVVEAQAALSRVRLVGSEHIRRAGGSVAGPVLFAMADIAAYALTLAQRQEECVTANLSMNFLRPALALPLIGEAVSLRAGRNLLIHDVRIWSEAEGPERLIAQATASWVALPNGNRP
jgi:uncharacterized protein (TIGR00369 family)